MADESKFKPIQIREFVGLATNANPHQIPPGAAVEQSNCSSPRVGELACRQGLREATFDN